MSNPNDDGSWTPQGGGGNAPQDPWAQPQGSQQYGEQNPYGSPLSDQQPLSQDPYGQVSGASASDPYGQEQQSWEPTGGSDASAPPPYGHPVAGSSGQPGQPGQPGQYGGQPGQFGQQPLAGGPVDPQAQSRLVVGLLGIFLGGFGVHRFLLGYTTIGILQIAVTLVTCGVGAWWGIIEGIMILAKAQTFERDAHGRPLTD